MSMLFRISLSLISVAQKYILERELGAYGHRMNLQAMADN